MARYAPIKNSFVAGELSPRLEGRDDLDQYFQGMRQAVNGVVLPHGGFMRRSGTRYVAAVKNSAHNARLVPWEYNDEQAYVLEFGDLYVRFYADEGVVESGGSPVEVVTPYLHTEVGDIQFAQEADVVYLVHQNHPPYKLTRTAATTFTLTEVAFVDGKAPLRSVNVAATTVLISGAGPYTLTWSASIGLTTAADVGRAVRINDGGEIWFEITAVTSTSVATATLKSGSVPGVPAARTDWTLGAFSDSEGPFSVAFHEGRLFYGGTPNTLDRFWGSVSDDFDSFELEDSTLTAAQNADRSFTRRLVSKKGRVNAIRWMDSIDDNLVIGTSGSEFRVQGENNDIITPSGAKQRSPTSRGSILAQPISIDGQIIFIQRNSRKLREFAFNLINDNFSARDISILAEHILRGGATRIDYQQDPDGVVWVVRADGVLVGFTYEAEQKVIGAHRHIFGGAFGSGDAVVEDVAVIPSPNANYDQLWLLVKRTINGATKRYVEFMEDPYAPDVDALSTQAELVAAVAEGWFVDCGLSYSGASTSTLSGLDHLEGQTVSVLADGSVHPDVVVTGGAVTLGRAVTAAVVGLSYSTYGETQRFIGGGRIGTDQGKLQRISKVIMRFHNTLGCKIGSGRNPTGDRLETLQFRTAGVDSMGDSPALFSGDIERGVPAGWSREPTLYFRQDQPLPLTVLAIMPISESGEG